MREGLPSGTSFLVSFARGLGVTHPPVDAMARDLLPSWLAALLEAPNHLGAGSRLYRRALRLGTMGLVDHAVLRTEAIDLHLAAALRGGVDQLVILGAGLDARAWRMPALHGSVVFEVDHPSTQRYKRRRIANKVPPTDIRYVAVDFEKQQFSQALAEAGFLRSAPSVWVWEGVTMYLPFDAVGEALVQINSLASAGSTLALTYRAPGMLPFGIIGRATIPLLFAAVGEPLKATLEPGAVTAPLGARWELAYDDDARGWKRLTGSHARPSPMFLSERLAVLHRRR